MALRATPSLFKRFFGLVENQPLYVMVGLACGLAVYTPIRHITHAPDIALDAAARDAGECFESGTGGRTLKKALEYRSGGVLAKAARVHDYCHVLPDVGVDRTHFDWKGKNRILDVGDFPLPKPDAQARAAA